MREAGLGDKRKRDIPGEVAVFWRTDVFELLSAETSIRGSGVLASKGDLGDAPVIFSTVYFDPFLFNLKFTPSGSNLSRILVGLNFWEILQEEC